MLKFKLGCYIHAGRPGPFLAPFGPIFCMLNLPLVPHLSPVVTMRQNISENVQFPVKMQHAPKSRTKIENDQVRVPSGGLVHKSSRRIYQNNS